MQSTPRNRAMALDQPLDQLFADIAIRVQLSQTAHDQAVRRYEAIAEWLDRDGSPLAGRIDLFYPQGSMAIGAAIASGVTQDDYDLDMVLQAVCSGLSPQEVLDLLFKALNGTRGSRYYGKVKRRTRCVTVEYKAMHIDVTPAERLPAPRERESHIFHHKHPQNGGQRIVANPSGFAEWFKQKTPDTGFAEQYARRARAYEATLLVEAAETEPVPPSEPVLGKSLAVVVLQLLKRWRNVQYQGRGGRKPPSIMMSKLVAEAAGQPRTLSEEVLRQARAMLAFFEQADRSHRRVHVQNPVCPRDVLTDRWPADLDDQAVFVEDLRRLVERLEQLQDCDLDEIRQIMAGLFGEGPTADAVERFIEHVGREIRQGKSRHRRNGGLVVAPGVAAGGVTAPRHKFYGGKWWR